MKKLVVMERSVSKNILLLIFITLASFGTVFLIYSAYKSFSWRYVHDSPIILYIGFLIHQYGAVPYRDIFDMNTIGSYWIACLMGKFFGWSNTSFRLLDIIWLVGIALITYLWMQIYGKIPAFFASLSFPLWYLWQGPIMSFQREYIALLPFAGIMMLSFVKMNMNRNINALLIGLCMSFVVLIKPQYFILTIPPLIVFLLNSTPTYAVKRSALLSVVGIGLTIPILGTVIYLFFSGGLFPFLDITLHYLPLYIHMTGYHMPIEGWERIHYIFISTLIGSFKIYLPIAAIGLFVLGKSTQMKQHVAALTALLFLSILYPAFTGQFWDYHWIPFQYLNLCLASLALRVYYEDYLHFSYIVVIISWIFVFIVLCLVQVDTKLHQTETYSYQLEVADKVSAFLKKNLHEGETVQPLDWTGGAVHGMLLAQAPLATRFIYDFHFYHHINSPYIQNLRREFVSELILHKPRYIIEVIENKPWPTGPNTTLTFPELHSILTDNYKVCMQDSKFIIYEKN